MFYDFAHKIFAGSSASSRRAAASALVLALFVFFAAAGAARAGVIVTNPVVDTTADDPTLSACTVAANDCSLRGAIAAAATGGAITFDLSVFGTAQTITLTNGDLAITKALSISGTGVGALTVSGNNASRVFYIAAGAGAAVNISYMTITGGNATGSVAGFNGAGGGIAVNTGTVTLTNCVVTGNTNAAGNGGGIYHQGTLLTLNNTVVSNNTIVNTTATTASGVVGGGIEIETSATLNNSIVSGNTMSISFAGSQGLGGGIYVGTSGTTLTVNNSVISGNNGCTNCNGTNAGGFGGGILSNTGTIVNINGSTISGNTSGSVAATPGSGGGLYLAGTSADIRNSTISGNVSGTTTASGAGGGIFMGTTALTITNSTISGNSAGNAGGGIRTLTGGTANLNNVTITNNSTPNVGAGIRSSITAAGAFTLRNTIVAGNTTPSNTETDIRNATSGAFGDGGNNLIGTAGTATGFTNGVNGNIVGTNGAPVDARLTPLGNYGGNIYTHALLVFGTPSPALNAGNNCVTTATCAANNPPFAVTTDQRGAARPFNTTVDIGAFEYNSGYTAVLPNGTQNRPYSQTIIPEAGAFSYCRLLGSDPLPPGLSGIPDCPAAFGGADNDLKNAGSREASSAPQAPVVISGTPTTPETYNFAVRAVSPGGGFVITTYQITIGAPTAANASVSGRVILPFGGGLTRARVTLTDSQGNSRSVFTGKFGRFNFDEVATGATYIVSVSARRYNFAPQVITVSEDISELTFTPESQF